MTGVLLLDYIIFGALAGVVLQGVATALAGRIPGPGLLIAALVGGVFGVVGFIFITGLDL